MNDKPVKLQWQAGRFRFDLASRPVVMGILNVTPDSFSDGARHASVNAAIKHGESLLAEGADLLDIGGESTRPGAAPVEPDDEWRRIGAVVEHFVSSGACVSVDTMKPLVMQRALAVGADIINDVAAFTWQGAIDVVSPSRCGLVVMHMQGEPRSMQAQANYVNVEHQVRDFLAQRCHALLEAGIARERIVLDPGFGFGKTLDHNLALLAGLSRFAAGAGHRYPVLAGLSRKSMLGTLTGRDVHSRQFASVAAAVLTLERGARILRVHDVAATVDAMKVWQALNIFETNQ
jgi:dihydropteroate synthase